MTVGRHHLLAVCRALAFAAVAGAIVFALTTKPANAAIPWSCEQVRWGFDNLTPAQLEEIAQRLNSKQRAEVLACLKSRK